MNIYQRTSLSSHKYKGPCVVLENQFIIEIPRMKFSLRVLYFSNLNIFFKRCLLWSLINMIIDQEQN